MTDNVIKGLEKIAGNSIFDDELYFTGGTALSYYIKHRISEDIDIVSSTTLNYKKIIPAMTTLGARKLQDEHVTALRMAGLFPDEYMIKFILNNVKIEFFQANRPIQKEILKTATYRNYENSKLKILDLKSIAKLKIVALLQREKSRDLFDFGAILDNQTLSINEVIDIANKTNNITEKKELINYISNKKEPKEDETVYLSKKNKIDLTFEEIKEDILLKL